MKTFRQIIQYDSQLGHTYVPNSTVRLRYGNDAYFIVTDANGFRNSPKKRKAKKTIILLGDSFTAGDGVPNEERFSDVLEELLDCTIINLGVSGYGVDQQLLAYEALAEQIPHDGVLLTPHLDDWARNLMQSREGFDKSTGQATLIPKPYFKLSNGELILQNVPVPLERVETDPLPEESYPNIAQRTKHYVERRLLKRHLHPELSDASSKEWVIMNCLLQRLLQKVGARPLMVAPFPFYDSVTYAEEPHFLEVLDKFVSNTAKTVDLVRPLNRVYAEAHDAWFLPLCGHFTPKAHRFIAETLSPSMQDFFGLVQRTDKSVSFPKEPAVYALGISCFYHDSAAALLKDGKIIAAAQEERFTRVKHDKSFPDNAMNYCLEEAGIGINELESIVYYDYETWTLERVLHNVEVIGDKGQQLWDLERKPIYEIKTPHSTSIAEQLSWPYFQVTTPCFARCRCILPFSI